MWVQLVSFLSMPARQRDRQVPQHQATHCSRLRLRGTLPLTSLNHSSFLCSQHFYCTSSSHSLAIPQTTLKYFGGEKHLNKIVSLFLSVFPAFGVAYCKVWQRMMFLFLIFDHNVYLAVYTNYYLSISLRTSYTIIVSSDLCFK